MIQLSFSNTRKIDITDCEWKDLQIAINSGVYQYGCFDGAAQTMTDKAGNMVSNAKPTQPENREAERMVDLFTILVGDNHEGSSERYRQARINLVKLVAKGLEAQWIPVSECLPDLETLVLIVTNEGGVFTGKYREVNGKRFWLPTGNGTYAANWGVTHWRPLPEPPTVSFRKLAEPVNTEIAHPTSGDENYVDVEWHREGKYRRITGPLPETQTSGDTAKCPKCGHDGIDLSLFAEGPIEIHCYKCKSHWKPRSWRELAQFFTGATKEIK